MKVCIIPARFGSKRIPKKNIKEFLGKPIIAYSIEVALASKCFDRVIVSTDNVAIGRVAEKFGAEVPFMRPYELSDDYTGTLPVVKHAIEWLTENAVAPSEVCCVYATAPFLQSETLNSAYQQFQEAKADYCFSVTTFEFPIQRAIKITQQKRVEMFFPENLNVRSQDLAKSYHDAGQFYWGRAKAFTEQKPFFSLEATPFILPRYLVQDIDTNEDWEKAEITYQVLKQSGMI